MLGALDQFGLALAGQLAVAAHDVGQALQQGQAVAVQALGRRLAPALLGQLDHGHVVRQAVLKGLVVRYVIDHPADEFGATTGVFPSPGNAFKKVRISKSDVAPEPATRIRGAIFDTIAS